MKKTITLLFTTVYLCACYSFHVNEAMKAEDKHFKDRLPYLEAVFDDEKALRNFSITDNFVKVNTPMANKFYREVEKNLINTNGKKRGYILLRPLVFADVATYKDDIILPIVSAAALGILNLFGMPLVNYVIVSELELIVLNAEGKTIKKYYSEKVAKGSLKLGGECSNDTNCEESVKWHAYEDALSDVLRQAYQDRAFLIKELNKQ